MGKPFTCKKIISKQYCHCMFGNKQHLFHLILVGIKSIVSIVPFMGLCFVFVMETVVDREVLFIEEHSLGSRKTFSALIN